MPFQEGFQANQGTPRTLCTFYIQDFGLLGKYLIDNSS